MPLPIIDSTGEGKVAKFLDPDAPYTGPGREALRRMAYNALQATDYKEWRRYARRGWLEGYMDEMADLVKEEAESDIENGVDSSKAWRDAIRMIIHGREPD